MEVPANLELLVRRLGNYTKKNVKVAPPQPFTTASDNSHTSYVNGTFANRRCQLIDIELPTNGVIDLETLTLSADLTAYALDNRAKIGLPRYPSQLFRNITVTCGGQRLTHPEGGSRYGQIYTMMQNAYGNFERWAAEAPFVGGGAGSSAKIGPYITVPTFVGATAATNYSTTVVVQGILGFLQGKYQRFLDLSIIPQISITFEVDELMTCFLDPTETTWDLSNFRITFDEIEFGDGTYHAMIAGALANGPVEIPFANYTWSESTDTSSTGGSLMLERKITASSLNTVIGSLRPAVANGPYKYGSLSTNVISTVPGTPAVINGVTYPDNAGTNPNSYLQQAPAFIYASGSTIPGATLNDLNAYPLLLGASPVSNTRYQIAVGSKLFPQYPATVVEAAQLARNNANAVGLNCSLGAMSHAQSLPAWCENCFTFPVSLHHNGDQPGFSRRDLISGASTGGYTNVRFTVNGITNAYTPGWRAVLLCEVTSRLLVFPERVIQVEH